MEIGLVGKRIELAFDKLWHGALLGREARGGRQYGKGAREIDELEVGTLLLTSNLTRGSILDASDSFSTEIALL